MEDNQADFDGSFGGDSVWLAVLESRQRLFAAGVVVTAEAGVRAVCCLRPRENRSLCRPLPACPSASVRVRVIWKRQPCPHGRNHGSRAVGTTCVTRPHRSLPGPRCARCVVFPECAPHLRGAVILSNQGAKRCSEVSRKPRAGLLRHERPTSDCCSCAVTGSDLQAGAVSPLTCLQTDPGKASTGGREPLRGWGGRPGLRPHQIHTTCWHRPWPALAQRRLL